MRTFIFSASLLACLFFGHIAIADVKPSSLFADNMVLQQGRAIPVWGTAAPGERVTVTFGNKAVACDAGADGSWRVNLPAQRATDIPATLTIAGKNTITVGGVVVGEVWVCSGQSNMEFTLDRVQDSAAEIAAADDPMIRMFHVGVTQSTTPQREVSSGSWAICSPKTAPSFSAAGYFFARELRAKLHVPIGMINASVGGTRAEPWTGFETFKNLPTFKSRAAAYEKEVALQVADPVAYAKARAQATADYPAVRAAWYAKIDAEDPGTINKWMAAGNNTSTWRTAKLPGTYGANPLGAYLGSLWCRKDVDIPKEWEGKDLELHVGAVDEADDTYVNGVHVGRTWFETPDYWKVPRIYTVPAVLVTSTKVTIVVRVLNLYGDVGLFGPASDMKIFPKGDTKATPVSLVGQWRYTEGLFFTGADIPQPEGDPPGGSGANPALLYNGMIAPLIPYAIKGVIWYQGESNADMPFEYRELFTGLMKSWRDAWGEGNFPFAYVQLANYLTPQSLPVEKGSWAEIRDAQREALSVPNTTMTVILDIGDILSIHPLDKQDVGKRLATAVLTTTYGEKNKLYSGPLYRSMSIKANKVQVNFSFAGGLNAAGGQPTGFAVAGKDKVFHVAHALIDHDAVLVWSDTIAKPLAVRYGWAMNPIGNIKNAAGLPASSFRTDDWDPREWTTANENEAAVGIVSRRGG